MCRSKTLNTTTDTLNSATDALTAGMKTLNSAAQTLTPGCKTKNIQLGSYTTQTIFSPASGGFVRLRPPVLFFNKRLVFLKIENPTSMDISWEITQAKGNPSKNYIHAKVGLYAQIGMIIQPDNRDITNLLGCTYVTVHLNKKGK